MGIEISIGMLMMDDMVRFPPTWTHLPRRRRHNTAHP
jgi:hypothetical protein